MKALSSWSQNGELFQSSLICLSYRVFIEYCGFPENVVIFPNYASSDRCSDGVWPVIWCHIDVVVFRDKKFILLQKIRYITRSLRDVGHIIKRRKNDRSWRIIGSETSPVNPHIRLSVGWLVCRPVCQSVII